MQHTKWKIVTEFGYSKYMECFYGVMTIEDNTMTTVSVAELVRRSDIILKEIFKNITVDKYPVLNYYHIREIIQYCYYHVEKPSISIIQYGNKLLKPYKLTYKKLKSNPYILGLGGWNDYMFALDIQKILKIKNDVEEDVEYSIFLPEEVIDELRQQLTKTPNKNIASFISAKITQLVMEDKLLND